jgi:hypothetical protein
MSRDGYRPHLESALSLDVVKFQRAGLLLPNHQSSGRWKWEFGDGDVAVVCYSIQTFAFAGKLTLRYGSRERDSGEFKPVVCVVPLTTTTPPYGGFRWWMHCPYTKKRARKLYKFGGIEQFCHREAIIPLPTYASQRVSGLAKIQQRRWAIRRRLGDEESGLGWGPIKPKWMRWKTFERYERLDDQLAELEDRTWSPYLRRLAATLG